LRISSTVSPTFKLCSFWKLGRPEKQDALGEHVGVLHLVDRFVSLVLGELVEPPVVEHPIVQPVLVDRGQFVGERLVEVLDDLFVTLHHSVPSLPA
jgi:hypothetical protein